jgi:hypothetical protein
MLLPCRRDLETDCSRVSETVALWATAWLTGNLSLDVTQEEMEWDVALRNAFMRRRYTVAGSISPYHLFEYLPVRWPAILVGSIGLISTACG